MGGSARAGADRAASFFFDKGDEALSSLTSIDPQQSRVVELRFFGGLSVKETAEVLKVSEETVHRDWKLAKSWLRRELS